MRQHLFLSADCGDKLRSACVSDRSHLHTVSQSVQIGHRTSASHMSDYQVQQPQKLSVGVMWWVVPHQDVGILPADDGDCQTQRHWPWAAELFQTSELRLSTGTYQQLLFRSANCWHSARLQVGTAVLLNALNLRDVTPCRLVNIRPFRIIIAPSLSGSISPKRVTAPRLTSPHSVTTRYPKRYSLTSDNVHDLTNKFNQKFTVNCYKSLHSECTDTKQSTPT